MKESEIKVVEVPVDKLMPHPQHDEIYGADEDVSDILESIVLRKKEGLSPLKNPVEANKNNQIICGKRCWMAARKARLATVPVIYVDYPDGAAVVVHRLLSGRCLGCFGAAAGGHEGVLTSE